MCVFPSISQSANYDRLTAQVLLRIYLFRLNPRKCFCCCLLNPRKLPSGTSMQDISCMFPISWSHSNMQSGRRASNTCVNPHFFETLFT